MLTMYRIDDIRLAKGMHIAHLNVRSIVNKWEVFKTHFSSSHLHILGISETWLNNKLPNDLYSLSNEYCLYRNDRGWTETGNQNVIKGGGVAIYVKNNLKSSNVEFQHFNNNNRDIESQWISIRQPNCKTIIIGNICRPPQGNIDNFVQVLEQNLDSIDSNVAEIFMMGNFNIDMCDKKNQSTKRLIELTKSYRLRRLISILDLIFTNSDFISNSGVCDINLSDHQMVLAT